MESLRVAVNDWLISNQWQGRTGNNVGTNDGTRVLLLASQPSAPGGNPRDVVKISAAFTYLTVSGTWNKPLGILQGASISLAVSGLGPATLLSGVDIPFYDIKSGRVDTYYVRIPADTHQPARVEGHFKFAFQTDDATKSTEATVLYWFSSPYTGPSPAVDSEKGVSLFPTTVAPRYQSDSYIIDVEDKIQTPATHVRPAEAPTTTGVDIHPVLRQGGESQMNLLLIKYLDDNGRNPSPGMYTMLLGYLREQYTMALYFNSGMLELFGSIDPATMYMAVDFYVRFPVARRIKLYNLRGSLLDEQAIQATVSEFVGGGSASFKAVKNATTGKYDLICSLYLKITLVAPEGISLKEQKILELPF
ncbi:hypothetical protein EST38_g760 [Candolleomyces aberdarensis]|uniref:Uncharacterized protein n=1 Tax=Candolleomyces aberdarensis TaxID=2316362 RepID=A0A4Q2DYS1_9AGAR|nr:hypothetical protein EST38_g760 [Candolleomyces aberdarensis]